jgi:hypothetical protein
MVRLVQTMNLSCTDTHYLQMERSKIPHDPCHIGVPSGESKMIFEPKVHFMQTMHLSCVKISTISKDIEISLEPRHLGLPSGLSKTMSEPLVRLAQTVDLSCTDTNTV